jgi:hypothetical protein
MHPCEITMVLEVSCEWWLVTEEVNTESVLLSVSCPDTLVALC